MLVWWGHRSSLLFVTSVLCSVTGGFSCLTVSTVIPLATVNQEERDMLCGVKVYVARCTCTCVFKWWRVGIIASIWLVAVVKPNPKQRWLCTEIQHWTTILCIGHAFPVPTCNMVASENPFGVEINLLLMTTMNVSFHCGVSAYLEDNHWWYLHI